jgi:C-terminal processing protease CtpA/Prc
MKTFWLKPGRLVFMWVIAVLLIQGCKKDEPDNEYQEINDWILENMETCYFWNTQIPTNTDQSLKPDQYFESLKYAGDRFSVIRDNFSELLNSLSGVNVEAGYDYYLMRYSEYSTDVIGCVTYIKPGTPAEAAGLKRGDYFWTINNTQMTTGNWASLLQATAKPHTLGKAIISGNTITRETTNISLSVIEYKENPILLDTIYHIQNKKIGYFVYNFFARDSETFGIAYEKELNNLFGKFADEAIDELIIDLRYNSGGTVITAMALASMISNRGATDIFGYEEYNSILDSYYAREDEDENYNISYFLDNIELLDDSGKVAEKVPVNKLSGLTRVYLIVSNRTASASELIINGLRPYMGDDNVVLIGGTTTGKNVGSFAIYETDPVKRQTNNWGMLPIVFKLSNSLKSSDYANGFTPNVEISEIGELEMKPLGDTDELLLSATLSKIFGTAIQRRNVREKPETVGSSIDRTPARKNMYIDPRFFHRK